MIPDSFIEQLKSVGDIEQVISSYISLKRRGRTLLGLCPFHSEKTPSFTVYTDTQSYYCYGCHSGGDAITFIRNIENLEYVEAIKLLAQRAGLAVPEDSESDGSARLKLRVLELNRAAARYYHNLLMSEQGSRALSYLTGRGLSRKTIRSFGLGYSPQGREGSLYGHLRELGFQDDELTAASLARSRSSGGMYDYFYGRVMFPILDLRGNVVGFGGRAMEDGKGPKYLNSPDTPVFKKSNNLYALNFAKSDKPDTLILAEGYMDVIALHQAGFTNAVATLGTSLTQEQARLISRYAKKVALAYDSDGAGQNAARRAIGLFSQIDVNVSVLEMTGAKDPDEYIKKFGAQRFEKLLSGGKGAVRFEIDKLRQNRDLDDPEGKTAFLGDFCRLMADLGNDLQRNVYISEIARELDVSRDRLEASVNALKQQQARARQKHQAHNLRPYVQDNAGKQRATADDGDLSGRVAEEKLICMIMKNPDYYDVLRSKITAEDFLDPMHAQIFRSLASLLEDGRIPEPIHLSGQLSPDQMSRLSQIMARGRELQFLRQQADEYIQALKSPKNRRSPEEVKAMSKEEYRAYISSLAAGKK